MSKYNKFTALFLAVSAIALVQAAPVVAEESEKIEEITVIVENPAFTDIVDFPDIQKQSFMVTQDVFKGASLKELTAIITTQAQQYANGFTIEYTGDTSNLEEEISKIFKDYLMGNDYANGTVKSYSLRFSGSVNQVTISINFEYHNTKEQEEFITKEVKRIAQEIIKPSMSDVEKIKAINDYIVLNTTYSYNTTTTPHSAYALFNEGKGVCQAYALAAYRLLKEAGFEARYVTGYAGELHAWNLVKVDGEWYHLDTTWNDPVFAESSRDMSDYVRYKYFLISDQEILKDHRIDDNGYPAARSDRFKAFRSVSNPVAVGSTLYFENANDDIKLYKLDMNANIPQAEKVSDTRVQFLTYANNALYFSNYSKGAYLYKMALDGSGQKLLVDKAVTSIKKTANEIIAYSNNVVIYREPIVPPVETIDLAKIEEFSANIGQIVFLSSGFKVNAEKLFELYKSLTSEEKALLSAEVQQKYALIKQQYDKMIALKFTDTNVWDAVKTEKDVNKPWHIKFNQNAAPSLDNLSKIQVVDMFGDLVDVRYEVNADLVTVIPTSSYKTGIVYTLVVPRDLRNTDGKTLGQGVHLQFVVTP